MITYSVYPPASSLELDQLQKSTSAEIVSRMRNYFPSVLEAYNVGHIKELSISA